MDESRIKAIEFYQKNIRAFQISMWTGLLGCYEINGIAEQLSFTHKLNGSPDVVRRRISNTIYYVEQWLNGDDSTVLTVRNIHDNARQSLQKKAHVCRYANTADLISQKDFEFIQFSFIGNLYLCTSEHFHSSAEHYWGYTDVTEENLVAFGKYWCYLMKNLGIDNEHNICYYNNLELNEDYNNQVYLEKIRTHCRNMRNLLQDNMDDYDIEDVLFEKSSRIESTILPTLSRFLLSYYYHTHNITTNENIFKRTINIIITKFFIMNIIRYNKVMMDNIDLMRNFILSLLYKIYEITGDDISYSTILYITNNLD